MSRMKLRIPTMSALSMSRSPWSATVLGRFVWVALLISIVLLIVTPWQQNVRATGRVIAFAPVERQQLVQAPISGRVAEFYVQEGAQVRKGDVLASVTDNDPEILDRLSRERDAVSMRLTASEGGVQVAEQRISALESKRAAEILSAEAKMNMARDKLEASERALDSAEAELTTAELNLERQKQLDKDGLTSRRNLELAQLAQAKAKADVEKAKKNRDAARQELNSYKADLNKVKADGTASIESAKASLRKSEAEMGKEQQELQKVESRLAKQHTQRVVAPRDGTVLRLLVAPHAEMLKAGDPIITFVPDISSSAVELWVDGNDAPLVTPGREVRLQFEGWPAIQFAGWPSVARGTFGGTVAFVDRHDDGKGRFRAVVVPDPDHEPWPDARYLRQGVRANGWVLLDRVRLGYEVWRKINGFPPAVDLPDAAYPKFAGDKAGKAPKTEFAKKVTPK